MVKDVEKMSYKELQELSARVKKAMATVQDRERAAVRQKLEDMASSAGFKLGELFGGRGKGRTGGVKYANPDDATQTWSGRGRKPKWLAARVKAGEKMEKFLVKG